MAAYGYVAHLRPRAPEVANATAVDDAHKALNPRRDANAKDHVPPEIEAAGVAERDEKMSQGWRRTVGNVRSFVGNSLGGLRGGANLASWAVAGTLAYFLWVKPSRDLKREQEEKAALAAANDPYRYVEKRKPIADP